MTEIDRVAPVHLYLERMTASKFDGVIALFEDDANVNSPFLGRVAAAPFVFRELGQATQSGKLSVFDDMLGENGQTAAAHIEYE